MSKGKIQFKVVVDPRVRDIVRRHSEQNGVDMSTTIARVVEEVLYAELTPVNRDELALGL